MNKIETQWALTALLSLITAFVLGTEWEKRMIINPGGQRDIQYASSDAGDYEDEDEDDQSEEYDDEEDEEINTDFTSSNTNKPQLKPTFKKYITPAAGLNRNNTQTNRQINNARQNENIRHIDKRTDTRVESGTAQRIYKTAGTLNAFYKFTNFRKDVLTIDYSMNEEQFYKLSAKYGYKSSELDKLQAWYKQERKRVWDENISKGESAAKRALEISDGDYDAKVRAFLYSRGLSLMASTKTIEPDVPNIIKKNRDIVKSVAVDIDAAAKEKGYSSEDIVGSVLSLVQTAVIYKIPPLVEEKSGIHIAGIFPPFRTLLTGWGDCDTKTALAGAILGSWNNIKMVGVSVPGHYLMAIRRMPAKGDIFIRYKGSEYVLIEPAGPAWLPPGSVAESTKRLIARQTNYKIEPFF